MELRQLKDGRNGSDGDSGVLVTGDENDTFSSMETIREQPTPPPKILLFGSIMSVCYIEQPLHFPINCTFNCVVLRYFCVCMYVCLRTN